VGVPLPLDPYLYRAYLRRAIDGDTILQDLDLGFGSWILSSKWPGGPDAKYPQGRYRLNGINTPEVRGAEKEEGKVSRQRLIDLCDSGTLLVRTTKHGKFRFLIDLYVKRDLPANDPFHALDVEVERNNWLSEDDVVSLISQSEGGASTVRALATEILWSRRALNGFSEVIHVNQTLIDEGLAKPYFGGKK